MTRAARQFLLIAFVGCADVSAPPRADVSPLDDAADATLDLSRDGSTRDVVDLTDIYYLTDVPDVQWGPRDATHGDVDCPQRYVTHLDDAGIRRRDRLTMCSEFTNGWSLPSFVCCRREFLASAVADPPEVIDPSWRLLCVHSTDCRLGGVP